MDTATANSGSQGSAAAPADPGLIASVEALWDDLRGLVHEHLRLAVLEAQRAGLSLVTIVVYGIVAGVLVASAWLGVVAALVLWLVSAGLNASLALLLAVLLNLAGAFGLVLGIRQTSRNLRFPATIESLRPRSSGDVPGPAVPDAATGPR